MARAGLPSQVLRQRHAAHLGHRFREHQHHHPATDGNDWQTILVGGLGAGGRAVYALDVTKPVDVDRSGVERHGTRALGIRRAIPTTELGYVYDAPTLVKTKATAGSRWSLRLQQPGRKRHPVRRQPDERSQLLKKLSTGVGSTADPSGLSTIRAFTASRRNPYVLQAYGGDLSGNIWRFDLSSADPTELESRADRHAEGRERQCAADHDRRPHGNRPEQQRRPLPVRRHGQAARRDRSRADSGRSRTPCM